MSSPYEIPAAPVTIEHVVKKSIFICRIIHAADREQCQDFITEIQSQYSDANHNCWAFIAGPPENPANWGMNDDGEPKGCAGRPMFNVLEHSGIGEICTVVTRYFGGIKLGTGGMARAYSGAVQLGMENLTTLVKKQYHRFFVKIGYEHVKSLEHLITKYEGVIIDAAYEDQVAVTMELYPHHEKEFNQGLQQLSKGTLSLSRLDSTA